MVLASVLLLGFWPGPYMLSVYNLESGGRALDAALVPVLPDRLAPEQVVDAGRLDSAIARLQRVSHLDPGNTQALRLLARAYLSLGKPEAALEALQQAATIRPASLVLQLELGDVYDSLGRTEEAVRAYEAGRVGSRGLPLAANYLKMAEVRAQHGSGDVAIALWRKTLGVDPGNLYALVRLAEIHRQLRDTETTVVYEERLRDFDAESVVVPLDPRLAEYQAQAMIALVDSGLWDRETLIDVISYQVQQFAEGMNGLMVEHILQVLLRQWPQDADIRFYQDELCRRRGDVD